MKSIAEELRLLLIEEQEPETVVVKKVAVMPDLLEPTRVVEMPLVPPGAIVLSFDPASAASVRPDKFGWAVLFCWEGLVAVIAAGVMPKKDRDGKPIDSRSYAGLALEFLNGIQSHYPDVKVWIAIDGRGTGTGFLEGSRELGGYDLSRQSIVEVKLVGQGKAAPWPPISDPVTGFRSLTVNTSHMIEAANSDLQSGKLVVSPNLSSLTELLDQRRRYRANKLPSGAIRYASGGTGHDDILSSVLMGNMLGRACVRKTSKIITPLDGNGGER